MTMTRSLIDMTTSMSCSMTRTVTPRRRAQIADVVEQLLAEDGRHAGHRLVEQDHARLDHQRAASSSSLRWPPESVPGILVGEVATGGPARAARPPALAHFRARAARPGPGRGAAATRRSPGWSLGGEHHVFQHASCGSARAASGRRAPGRRARSRRRASASMRRPAKRIAPRSGRRKPEMRLKTVVLPAPFGPIAR